MPYPQQIDDWVDEVPDRNAQMLDVFDPGAGGVTDWVDEPQASQSIPPKVDTLTDVVKSIPAGLQRGAAATAMMLPNIANAAVAGPQYLYEGLIGRDRPDFKPVQPFYSSEDALQMLPEGARPYNPQTGAGKAVEFVSEMVGGVAGAKAIRSTPKVAKTIGDLLRDTQTSKTVAGVLPKAITPAPHQATMQEVERSAQQKYALADQTGGVLKPSAGASLIKKLDALEPQSAMGKKLVGENEYTKMVSNLKNVIKGKKITLKDAEDIDDHLREAVESLKDRGVPTPASNKMQKVRSAFIETIKNPSQSDIVGGKNGFAAWKEGDRLWFQKSKMKDIQTIMDRADLMDNPVTGLRTGARNLLLNEGKISKYSPAEKKLIERMAKGNLPSNAAKLLGSRLIQVIGLSTGAGGPAGMAATNVGPIAARSLAVRLQMKRAQEVLNEISNAAMNPPPPPMFGPAMPAMTAMPERTVPYLLGSPLLATMQENQQ